MQPRTSLAALLFCAGALLCAAPARAWQGEADDISSAAAASVVLFSLCDLPSAPRVAQQAAALLRGHGRRLAEIAGVDAPEVVDYLLESSNRKVHAFWLANHERGCGGTGALRDFAVFRSFPTPH